MSREVAKLSSNCHGPKDSAAVDLSAFDGRFLRSKAAEVAIVAKGSDGGIDADADAPTAIQGPSAPRCSTRLQSRLNQHDESPAKKPRVASSSKTTTKPSSSTASRNLANVQSSSTASNLANVQSKYPTLFNFENLNVASVDWISELLKYEQQFPAPSKDEVIVCKEGQEFNKIFDDAGGFEGFVKPYIIKQISGLGFDVDVDMDTGKIVEALGRNFPTNAYFNKDRKYATMTMGKFLDLWTEKKQRTQPVNLLQLEVGSSDVLDKGIGVPEIFKQCLIQNIYENDEAAKQLMNYPKPSIKKFCLLTMAESYTDFHIDFSGTSFWFYIQKGRKIFYLIAPTATNLAEYEDDEMNGSDTDWLGDRLSTQVRRIELTTGQMMFVPSGWLHAVFTPVDTVVFGGSILTLPHLKMQMTITGIETRLRIKEVMPNLPYLYFAIAQYLLLPKLQSTRDLDQTLSDHIRDGTSALIEYLNGFVGRNVQRKAILKELVEEFEHHQQAKKN